MSSPVSDMRRWRRCGGAELRTVRWNGQVLKLKTTFEQERGGGDGGRELDYNSVQKYLVLY